MALAVRKSRLIIGGLFVLALLALLVWGRGDYRRSATTLDSAEARGALAAIQAVVEDPASVPAHMSHEASRMAADAVAAFARGVHGAGAVHLEDAVWFGDFLRVTVRCESAGGEVSKQFYLARDGGKMLITGVER